MDLEGEVRIQAVGGLIEKDGKYLLIVENEEPRQGMIKFPTEKLKRIKSPIIDDLICFEDPIAGLKRGIYAETGYRITDIQPLYSRIRKGFKGDIVKFIDFYAQWESGVFTPNKEVKDIKWVDIECLMQMRRLLPSDSNHYHRIKLLLNFKGILTGDYMPSGLYHP